MFALVNGELSHKSSVLWLSIIAIETPLVDMDAGPSLTTMRGLVRNNDFSYRVNFEGGTAFDSTWHSVVFRRNGTNFNIFADGVI